RPVRLSTLFPYTTLFRSAANAGLAGVKGLDVHLQRGHDIGQAQAHGVVQVGAARLVAQLMLQATEQAADLCGIRIAGRVRQADLDRKSTRLNSSHVKSSY